MFRKTFTYDGKRYYLSAKSKKELEDKVKKKKQELEKSECYTFDEWTDIYFDTYKTQITHNTLYNYSLRFKKYISPFIGGKRLDKITQIDCQRILNNVSSLSNNYIHKIYHDLDQTFRKAIDNQLITFNPVRGCEIPKGYVNTHRIITDEERRFIISCAMDDLNCSGIYILLMLYCGCRPDETSYITIDDIKDDMLHIRGVKTALADRYVPIPNVLLDLIPFDDRYYLVSSISGIYPAKKHHRVKLWNRFKTLLQEKVDVKDDLTPYCLRHTYCTDLRDAGIPLSTAKDLMGHSTVKLTADIYTHQTFRNIKKSAERLNAHLLHK